MNNNTDLERLAQEFLNTKSLLDKVTARFNELKQALTEAVDNDGYEDDKGHRWLPVGSLQLKRERRATVSFDVEAAEEWAKAEGIFDDVKKVIVQETIDHDLLLAYAWEHRELTPVVKSFNKEKVSWAFKVVEKRSYDEES